jgi:ribonuclease R
VRDVRRSRRDPGERRAYSMIEQFMLAANEAVAEMCQQRGDVTVWRIHDAPDEEKLEAFAEIASRYGIQVDVDAARTPRGLQKVLERLRGHPAEKALSFQILRSLKQATYDVVNIGHFGLASRAYLHFTSPIRRYPDVLVHRLLKQRLAALGKPAGGFAPLSANTPPPLGALQKAAADASFSERKAMEVEREVVDLYRAFFLRDRVGDVFDGTISGVAGFGTFVTVDEPFVEGLVRVEYLRPDDYYIFDETALRMVGKRTGIAFALGDRVRIEVLSVSVARRKIDFRLHGHEATVIEQPGERRKRGERRARSHDRKHVEGHHKRGERREPDRDRRGGGGGKPTQPRGRKKGRR